MDDRCEEYENPFIVIRLREYNELIEIKNKYLELVGKNNEKENI